MEERFHHHIFRVDKSFGSFRQRIHAQKRAWERYGLSLHSDELQTIVDLIQTGGAICWNLTETRSIFLVEYRGISLRGVYDKARKSICTFLPLIDTYNSVFVKREKCHE